MLVADDEPVKPKEVSHMDVLSEELQILHVAEWLMDVFQKVDGDTLASMLAHAKCRLGLRFSCIPAIPLLSHVFADALVQLRCGYVGEIQSRRRGPR